MSRASRGLGAAVLAASVSACVMVPKTVVAYDPECRVVARQMTLEAVQVASIGGCADKGCAVLLAAAGVTAAASMVISGSIAIAGNVVYWLERQGTCQRGPEGRSLWPAPAPPPLPPQPLALPPASL